MSTAAYIDNINKGRQNSINNNYLQSVECCTIILSIKYMKNYQYELITDNTYQDNGIWVTYYGIKEDN